MKKQNCCPIYIRHGKELVKTDKDGALLIAKYYPDSKESGALQYYLISAFKTAIKCMLFPVWLVLYIISIITTKLCDSYEKLL